MRFATVTLGYEEVEWIDPRDDIKAAIWDDTKFTEWLEERDLLVALHAVTSFQRDVANNLRRVCMNGQVPKGWPGRAIYLSHRLKKRRQELRALVRESYGQEFLAETVRDFDARHPRQAATK